MAEQVAGFGRRGESGAVGQPPRPARTSGLPVLPITLGLGVTAVLVAALFGLRSPPEEEPSLAITTLSGTTWGVRGNDTCDRSGERLRFGPDYFEVLRGGTVSETVRGFAPQTAVKTGGGQRMFEIRQSSSTDHPPLRIVWELKGDNLEFQEFAVPQDLESAARQSLQETRATVENASPLTYCPGN